MNYELSLVTFYLSLFLLFTSPLKAQVTIGDQKAPESFSLLELIGNKGLRMPQLTNEQRDALDLNSNPEAAKGLCIYNISINCLEFWNGVKWVSLCSSVIGPDPPPTFSLFYSEGNLLMSPSVSLPANYSISNLSNSAKHTIAMTSPIGANTSRYFTCLNAAGTSIMNQPATISLNTITNPNGDPTFTLTNSSLKTLQIPKGYVGEINLTIGNTGDAYIIEIDVQANRTPSNSVKIGETFSADGYEWRVLAKGNNTGSDDHTGHTLIITEHPIGYQKWADTSVSSSYPGWKTNSDYSISLPENLANLKKGGTWLTTTDKFSMPKIESGLTTLKGMLQTHTLISRRTAYEASGSSSVPNSWGEIHTPPYGSPGSPHANVDRYSISVDNKLFLLSLEEINYGIKIDVANHPKGDYAYVASGVTTDVAEMRTSGSIVLFADLNAAMYNGSTTAVEYTRCWLRTACWGSNTVNVPIWADTGTFLTATTMQFERGIRPACWVLFSY